MELTSEETGELRSWISGGGPSLTIPQPAEPVTGFAVDDRSERGVH